MRVNKVPPPPPTYKFSLVSLSLPSGSYPILQEIRQKPTPTGNDGNGTQIDCEMQKEKAERERESKR